MTGFDRDPDVRRVDDGLAPGDARARGSRCGGAAVGGAGVDGWGRTPRRRRATTTAARGGVNAGWRIAWAPRSVAAWTPSPVEPRRPPGGERRPVAGVRAQRGPLGGALRHRGGRRGRPGAAHRGRGLRDPRGPGRFTAGTETRDVGPGDTIFVAAEVPHRFHDVTEELRADRRVRTGGVHPRRGRHPLGRGDGRGLTVSRWRGPAPRARRTPRAERARAVLVVPEQDVRVEPVVEERDEAPRPRVELRVRVRRAAQPEVEERPRPADVGRLLLVVEVGRAQDGARGPQRGERLVDVSTTGAAPRARAGSGAATRSAAPAAARRCAGSRCPPGTARRRAAARTPAGLRQPGDRARRVVAVQRPDAGAALRLDDEPEVLGAAAVQPRIRSSLGRA